MINIVDFNDRLVSAERELRNRRFIVEADSVSMARHIIIPLAVEMYDKEQEPKEDVDHD